MAKPSTIPDERAFKQLLELSQAKQEESGETPFSTEEKDKFAKAFEDPEFRKMFAEYMDELQNPIYREETEAYISQLEGDNKVPAGKQIVRPTPCFVVKTHKESAKSNTSENNDKIFINIVQSDKITKPTSTQSKEGAHWSVPYSVGPVHMEVDKAGSVNVPSFDCCFHPEAIKLGERSKAFKDLLIQTAVDGVEAAYRKNHQQVKLDKPGARVLKGVLYKSGEIVPSMLIDVISTEKEWQAGSVPSASNVLKGSGIGNSNTQRAPETEIIVNENMEVIGMKPIEPSSTKSPEKQFSETKTSTETGTTTVSNVKKKSSGPAIKSGFLNNAKSAIYDDEKPKTKASNPLIQEITGTSTPGHPVKSTPVAPVISQNDTLMKASSTKLLQPASTSQTAVVNGAVEPQYTITERGAGVVNEFEAVSRQFVGSNRPAELVIKIDLPKVSKPSEVILDLESKKLKLQYQDVYLLVLKLPYTVEEKKGGAKYDKVNKRLVVTLPVAKDSAPATVVSGMTVSDAVTESELLVQELDSKDEVKTTSVKTKSSITDAPEVHKRWVSGHTGDSTSTGAGSSLADEIKQKADAAVLAYTADQKERESKPPVSAVVAAVADLSLEESPVFIPSKSFVGKKSGYVFKRGEGGELGYYKDSYNAQQAVIDHAKPFDSSSKAVTTATDLPIEFQEQLSCVSIIVSVPKIKNDSVLLSSSVITIQDLNSSLTQHHRSPIKSTSNDAVYTQLHLKFDCFVDEKVVTRSGVIVFPGEISAQHTVVSGSSDLPAYTYDVASENMVIICAKKNAVMWSACAYGDITVMSLPFEVKQIVKQLTDVSKTPVSIGSSGDKGEISTPNVGKIGSDLSFASITNSKLLFELD